MPPYDIRPARTPAERAAAFNLRYELYVAEQGLFGESADHERRELCEPADAHSTIWVIEHEGEIVGTARLRWGQAGFDEQLRAIFATSRFTDIASEAQMAAGERMVILPAHRGGSLVVHLVNTMWAHAIERGVELILIDCEPHLLNRWISLGFRPYGLCEHPTNGTLVRTAYVLGDLAYAERLGTPLREALATWTRSRETASALGERLRDSTTVLSQLSAPEQFWPRIEAHTSRAFLCAALGQLEERELSTLLVGAHYLDCEEGAALIRKHHVSRTLYVLLDGCLDVIDEGACVARVCEPGTIFGEVALFAQARRTSDVRASPGGAQVLALHERSIRKLIDAGSPAASKFLLCLMRNVSAKFVERTGKHPARPGRDRSTPSSTREPPGALARRDTRSTSSRPSDRLLSASSSL